MSGLRSGMLNPPGPRTPAEGLARFDLLPDQAANVTLIWAWAGEPFGSLESETGATA